MRMRKKEKIKCSKIIDPIDRNKEITMLRSMEEISLVNQ